MPKSPEQELSLGTYRLEGRTPSGGAYSLAVYRNQHGDLCRKEDAVTLDILEMSAEGVCIHCIHGYVRPPEEIERIGLRAKDGWPG